MAATSHESPESVGHHPTPFRRLVAVLKQDRRDLVILGLYTLFSGLLSLAVPLAAQALVNTIAAGVFLQPLVVLTAMLFVGLLFAGVLKILQFCIVEVLQQRVFARVALSLAQNLPRLDYQALLLEYPPELLNRFFDIMKLQKTLAKLLMDGPAAVLQILVGLVLMAVYSPVLLGFDLLIIGFVCLTAFGLGRKGVDTSIQESAEKYRVAGWLEELARCGLSFKLNGVPQFLFERADTAVLRYIRQRKQHFRILFRQAVANIVFQAFASAAILGIGGWLVIHRQLTLGQLVASELVILILLAALDKLIFMFQDWYDLLTSQDKIGHVLDLPLQKTDGKPLPTIHSGIELVCQDLTFGYQGLSPVISNLNLAINPGERVSLVGASGAGKSTLASMFCGLLSPQYGVVQVNGVDVREVDKQALWQRVAMVSDSADIFEGTVEENIRLGRTHVSSQVLNWALEVSHLHADIVALPQGLQTQLVSTGRNLSKGQVQRLMIARAILDQPQLLILDEAFTGIDERTKLLILENLFNPQYPWTILDISHDAELVIRSNRVLVLQNGHIQESGTAWDLAHQATSSFSSLFPDLANRMRGRV